MQLFARLTKVDEAKRTIYGRAVQEVVDKSDEIFDYESSKPYFAKWSEEVAADTDGKSLGNLRAMHGKVAAGKLTDLQFIDAEKAIDVAAKVVDDAEWNKVLEGVYTGFSIGGSYVGAKKIEKHEGRDVARYTAKPSELSLVDRPCIPTAKFFEVAKADGTTAQVDFKDPAEPAAAEEVAKTEEPAVDPDEVTVAGTADEVAQLGKAMNDAGLSISDVIAKIAARDDASPKEGESKYGDVNFADEKNKKYPLDTAAHVRSAASYFGMEKNRSKYSEDDQKAIDAKIAKAKKKFGIGDDADKAEVPTLRKGLYTCGVLAQLLAQIESVCCSVEYECEMEGDGSDLGARLTQWLADGGDILGAMVKEEIDEATGKAGVEPMEPDAPMLALSERAGALSKALAADLAKIGARNSKADQDRIQKMHDHSVDLGATCQKDDGGDMAMAEPAPVQKDEPTELQKALADALAPMQKALEAAQEQIKKLEAQPAPARVALRAVAKSEDVIPDSQPQPQAPAVVKDAFGELHEAAGLIKSAHRSGGAPLNAPLRK